MPKQIRSLLLLPLRNNPDAYTRAQRKLSGYEWRLDRKVEAAAAGIRQMAAGCKSPCFIDCGFNEAVVLGKFERQLPGFAFHGYEVQRDLFAAAKSRGLDAELHNAAVWTGPGEIEVKVSSSSTYNQRGGTSVMDNALSEDKISERYSVPTRDFLDDLRNLRKKHDFIAVKMDIEGAEYDVLERVLGSGERLIDMLMIEFHPKIGGAGRHARLIGLLDAENVKYDAWY